MTRASAMVLTCRTRIPNPPPRSQMVQPSPRAASILRARALVAVVMAGARLIEELACPSGVRVRISLQGTGPVSQSESQGTRTPKATTEDAKHPRAVARLAHFGARRSSS